MGRGWTELLRSLGDSLFGVVEAEAAALQGDLKATGRGLAKVVMLGAAAAFAFFWVVGAAAFLLFQVALLWLPGWGAAALTLAILLAVGVILAAVARARLRALEPPRKTIRRHYEDHVAWWRSQVLVEEGRGGKRLAETEMESGELENPS